MNMHSINEDTQGWWWTSAAAGMAAAVAIVGIVVAPMGTQAMPANPAPATVVTTEPVDTAGDRPCFIEQARWNVAYDGPVPRC